MIGTVLRVSWLSLMRDRTTLMLTFLMPIAFFSIFGFIYSNMGGEATSKVEVALVDEDRSEASTRFTKALKDEISLSISTGPDGNVEQPWDRESAMNQVRTGKVPVVLIIPKGFGATFGSFGGDQVPIEMVADEANPVAPQMVMGLMQKAAMTSVPDLMITRGLEMFDQYKEETGGLTQQQRAAMDKWLPQLREQIAQRDENKSDPQSIDGGKAKKNDDGDHNSGGGFAGPVQVKMSGLRSDLREQRGSLTAYSAAGMGVMFLLFSMAGASGTLLEEQESGSLERVLTSNIGMTRLLLSKWLFIAIMGIAQVTIMFIFGWMAFHVDLWSSKHLAGFAIMTTITAASAAAFGMLLATACRTRGQLGGVSTLVILIMSAAGGSMIPRIFMPEVMKKIGSFTFNGWALDGYQKVFWYENATDNFAESVLRLWPQVAMLAALTVAFLLIARILARRWEAA